MRALILIFIVSSLQAQPDTLMVNDMGMEFVAIPPGTMMVGRYQPISTRYGFIEKYITPGVDPGIPLLSDRAYSIADSIFQRETSSGFEVVFERSFWMARTEVTQRLWKEVMGYNPSYFQGARVNDLADQHPVENVSWEEAQRFIKLLNAREKGPWIYRLPTEFEWEYAARAGATDDIAWDDINATAHIASTSTQMVGMKKPNAWGLYDMLGNVWEWVDDFYNEKMFAEPKPPRKGKQHVLKGAPFYGDVKNATYLTHAGGPGSGYDVGFRIVAERADRGQ